MERPGVPFECPVCAAQDRPHLATYSCGHRLCCECALTTRCVQRSLRCVLCKEDARCIVHPAGVTAAARSDRHATYVPELRCHVHELSRAYVDELGNPPCPGCGRRLPSFADLRTHMAGEGLHYCDTCLRFKPALRKAMPAYTQDELRGHLREHPKCQLCGKLQYDADGLQHHHRTAHVRCELCVQLGVRDSYWADHAALQGHYTEAHHCCDFRECRAMLVGFAAERDLLVHMVEDHADDLGPAQLAQWQQRLQRCPARPVVDVELWASYQARYGVGTREQRPRDAPQPATDELGRRVYQYVEPTPPPPPPRQPAPRPPPAQEDLPVRVVRRRQRGGRQRGVAPAEAPAEDPPEDPPEAPAAATDAGPEARAQAGQQDEDGWRRGTATVLSLACFGPLANELSAVRAVAGEPVAALTVNLRYDRGEALRHDLRGVAGLRRQSRAQGLPLYDKQGYQDAVRRQPRFLVSGPGDLDSVREMLGLFSRGALDELQAAAAGVDGVELEVLSRQPWGPPGQPLLVQADEDEYRWAAQAAEGLGLSCRRADLVCGGPAYARAVDNLVTHFRRQQCRLHGGGDARCCRDWALRFARGLRGLG